MYADDNLPPGVRITDIPGNRPEDEGFDNLMEFFADQFREMGFDVGRSADLVTIKRIWLDGRAAVEDEVAGFNGEEYNEQGVPNG